MPKITVSTKVGLHRYRCHENLFTPEPLTVEVSAEHFAQITNDDNLVVSAETPPAKPKRKPERKTTTVSRKLED